MVAKGYGRWGGGAEFDYKGLIGGGGTVLTCESGDKSMYLSTLTGLYTKE